MKSNAPWSVKGIERDARETAKEAAHREGMTVGAWLNQMIYSAGDPERAGAIEGLKVDDIVTAIDHLSQRVANAESKSADAVEDLAKNFGGVVERVQRIERIKPAAGSNADLETRVAKIEEKSGDRQRIDTLKALEKAVGQIALQFETVHKSSLERVEANEKQLQQLASRIDTQKEDESTAGAIGFLKDAVDGMSARIARAERIASQASRITGDGEKIDEDFVERTGKRLRVLGDEIKRGGDQIRTLETTITKLSKQIDAAERRSSEGVQKVAETISQLRNQLAQGEGQDGATARDELEAAVAAATKRTEDRIASLQNSFEVMISRLEGKAQNQSATTTPSESQAAPDIQTKALLQSAAPAVSIDAEDDLDADFEDAFAAIDLDEDADVEPAPSGVESDPEDEFSFDLDAEGPADEISADTSEAEDILSQVQDAFGETASPQQKAGQQKSLDNAADESDLDAVLAELDGMGFDGGEDNDEDAANAAQDGDEVEEVSIFGRKPVEQPPVEEQSEEVTAAKATAAPDFLKDARQKAKAAAAKAAEEVQTKKRKLTPKQRVILAARIRRKRLEAQKAGENADGAVAGQPPAIAAQPAPAENEDGSTQEENDPAVKRGLLASLTSMLPFLGKKGLDEKVSNPETDVQTGSLEFDIEATTANAKQQAAELDEATEDLVDPIISEDGNPNLAGALTKTIDRVKSKPVTLALGAAILLAVLALFFLVKDLASGSKQDQAPRAAASGELGDADIGPALKDALRAEVPTAPLVRPRALYLDSISALRASTTEEEERNALQGLQEAAALGHPPAQLQIGELYKIGQGFEKDSGQARAWYERAANGGNVLAMHRMGVMTARGEGGSTDMQASVGWFEKAGNFGLVDSQYNLGATFHPSTEGANSVQDRGRAYFWYSLAAANGDAQAGALAAGLGEAMTPEARAALNAEVTAWTPLTPDPDANELASAA